MTERERASDLKSIGFGWRTRFLEKSRTIWSISTSGKEDSNLQKRAKEENRKYLELKISNKLKNSR